jgi:hypothetical protein
MFCAFSVFRMIRWAGHVKRMEDRIGRDLMGRRDGKRLFGRRRHRWEDIKMDLQELRRGGVHWIGLAQNRDRWRSLVNAVMNLWVP